MCVLVCVPHWAAHGRQGAPSETLLSFCPALVGNSEIPPGTCPAPLWESLVQVEASQKKKKQNTHSEFMGGLVHHTHIHSHSYSNYGPQKNGVIGEHL